MTGIYTRTMRRMGHGRWFAIMVKHAGCKLDKVMYKASGGRVTLAGRAMPTMLLTTRGRLAMMLADMPGRWQDQFLKPGPWPEEFVSAMRAGFLRAGPDFQFSEMTPRPLELGAITTLTNLGNLPYFRIVFIWLCFALFLVILFKMTH